MWQGNHSVQVLYRECTVTANIWVNWVLSSGGSAPPPTNEENWPPLPASATSVQTKYGDYTPCLQQKIHQSNCFVSDGAWDSPNLGSVQMELQIESWVVCSPPDTDQTFWVNSQVGARGYRCSKTLAGWFPRKLAATPEGTEKPALLSVSFSVKRALTAMTQSSERAIRARYVHTNLIARDWQALARFYEVVFGCLRVPPERDLTGPVMEAGTGIPAAHLRGVHLRLPGHGDTGPTLEVFTYDRLEEKPAQRSTGPASSPGVQRGRCSGRSGHDTGGRRRASWQVVTVAVSVGHVTWCYVTDPEGNIIELQSWAG
jgi:hypothetical protein